MAYGNFENDEIVDDKADDIGDIIVVADVGHVEGGCWSAGVAVSWSQAKLDLKGLQAAGLSLVDDNRDMVVIINVMLAFVY